MDHFWRLWKAILVPWRPVFCTLGHQLMVEGSTEAQRGHLGLQDWILNDFDWIWGPCWESILGHLGILWAPKVSS